MVTKRMCFTIDTLIDMSMNKLFMMAEYVCNKTSFVYSRKMRPQTVNPIPPQNIVPTIHFSKEDKMVMGELFKLV